MKTPLLLILLVLAGYAQAGCLESWKVALEGNRHKLNPVDRIEEQKPEGIIEVMTDHFLGLGESVSSILEKSTLVPRVRFQEKIIRLLEAASLPEDVGSLQLEYTRRFGQTNKALFLRKLTAFSSTQENLCLSAEQLQKKRSLPLTPASFIWTESEFYEQVRKTP